MSIPEIYITTAIRGTAGQPRTAAFIRTQLTQYRDFKLRVPRKGYRSADISVSVYSDEIAILYSDPDNKLETYSNFLYVIWRSHVVFWGPITTKEVSFEDGRITLHAFDQGARLEHHYFRIGDDVMDVPGDITKGHLPVNAEGIHLSLLAGEISFDSAYIPLGIRMGSNAHTDSGRKVQIERGQEIWRTMMDIGDRTDGPLFEFVPLTVSDTSKDFAVCNVFGQFRNDVSSVVRFEYDIGLNNVRNMNLNIGGELLSHTHVLTQNNQWRTTTASADSAHDYGVWIRWEQVDFNLSSGTTEAEANAALGAVGDAILDQYGRPLTSVEITLRRDDQMQDNANQFHWLTDFKVADIVHVHGNKGHESVNGDYLIDEVRLEQESDNSGQVRQAMDVIPFVPTGHYTYYHNTDFITDQESGGG